MVFCVNEVVFIYFMVVFVFVVGVCFGCCIFVVFGVLVGLWLGGYCDFYCGVVVVDVVEFVLCDCIGVFVVVCVVWYYQQLL